MVAPISTAKPRFPLGQVVMTPGAMAAIEEAGQQPIEFIARHVCGDWGSELDAEDAKANDAACQHEGDVDRQERILSAYKTRLNVKIWVITESTREVTTLLLPEEY